MKYSATILLAFFLACSSAFAQPEVSYILPDIGTPNMNTYVEVFAPFNADGAFGADGLSLNNPGDAIRLELVNPLDSNKVIIGPLIISWRGKLISTQIFVRPTLPVQPNSDDWEQLTSAFRIPIRVRVNGITSNVDTFYIVKPFHFGDKSGSPERVLGAGALGKRSRRGAMLVDSMMLAPAMYSVSTADCDRITVGNQGYLPFVLIAQGTIQSQGGGGIQVNGNARNGGPGGGGGAGRMCDANFFGGGSTGSDGGDGYTGGGRGGRNNGGKPGNPEPKNSGNGTGKLANTKDIGGLSLNGVQGGEAQPGTFEDAGGGTGHPFGLSGTGWNGVNQNTITGAYGGGTGQSQSEQGGPGGFGTDGESPTKSNGGKAHGNNCVVPIAGGSGGASGNPQYINGGCGGDGGGGGGALRVAAKTITNLDFSAFGGLGEDQSPAGGSGSGGHIALQAKLSISAWRADVQGGGYTPTNNAPRGGHGRFRYDSPVLLPDTSKSFHGTIYQGPTTDTQSIVKRIFILRGHGIGQPVLIFIKPEFGPWTLADSSIGGSGDKWDVPIDLNDPRIFRDSRYYIVAAQRINRPSTIMYRMEPDLVMSQVAANIVIIADQPIIASQRSHIVPRVVCPGASSFDTLKVTNDGAADLMIDPPTWQKNNQGFSVVSPAFPLKVKPTETRDIIVRFSPPAGNSSLIFSDSVVLVNNDPEKGKSPWTVGFLASRDTLFTEFLNRGQTATIDTIDFGKLCLGETTFTAASLKNRSSKVITAAKVIVTDNVHFSASFTGSPAIATGGALDLGVGFAARSLGKMTALLVLQLDECNFADTLVLIGEGIETQLEFTGTGQFSRVRVGDTKTIEVEIKNTGNVAAELETFPLTLPPPFRIVSVLPPSQTVPPGGIVKIQVEYTPTGENYDSAFLEIRSLLLANTCPDTARLLFAGLGIKSDLRPSAPSFVFGTIAQCDNKLDSVTLKNFGTADVTLTEQAIITGQNFGAFSILSQPNTPIVLKPGDSTKYVVRFTASLGVNGLNTAILTIPTDDAVQPRVDLPLSGRQEPTQLQIPQAVISGGIVPVPQSVDVKFDIQNTGPLTVAITSVLSSRSVVSPQTATLIQNDIVNFTAKMTANQAGIIRDTVRIVFSQPCPDTQIVIIEITAVEASLAFSNALDFGKIASCKNVIDTVAFSNSGLAQLELQNMTINGTDAAVFQFDSPANFRILLDPGQTFKRAVKFDPLNATDGIKTAEVITTAMINGQTREFHTTLRGERETALLAAPGNIVFGNVEMLTTAQQRLTVTNTSSQTILIDRIQLASGNPFSRTIDPPNRTPLSLAPGETVTITVSFTPTSQQSFIDTLLFLQSQPCDDIRKITITGTGLPTLRSALYLPVDEQVDPTSTNYRLPIKLRITPTTSTLSNASFLAEFTVDERIFLPQSVSKGVMTTSVNPTTRQRTIRITADNISTSGPETTIAEITGTALLGSVEQDSLRWVQFGWTAGTTARVDSLIDGHLKLILCEKGGKRLLNDDAVRAFGLAAAPNPAENDITIAAYTVEVGAHTLELVNVQGRTVYSEQWNIAVPSQAGAIREIVIPAGNLAAGVYTAILRTPAKLTTIRVIVAK